MDSLFPLAIGVWGERNIGGFFLPVTMKEVDSLLGEFELSEIEKFRFFWSLRIKVLLLPVWTD